MGLDVNFGRAFAKSQIATGINLPSKGNIFISVKDKDKPFIKMICKRLVKLGFKLVCTKGTGNFLKANIVNSWPKSA